MDARLLKGKKVTLVPMYDAVLSLSDVQWWEYRHFKIVSFCEALTKKLRALGMDFFSVKFFPPVAVGRQPPSDGPLKVFFWKRGLRPDITMVVEMLPRDAPVELFYRSDLDETIPNVPANIQLISLPWFATREEYLRQVGCCDLYVSPRESEGIGLSFLEALALGIPVLAMDAPTMNEYVQHGKNGFLFGRPASALTKELLVSMQGSIRSSGASMRRQFELQVPSLLQYLLEKPQPHGVGRHMGFETVIVLKQLARHLKASARKARHRREAEKK